LFLGKIIVALETIAGAPTDFDFIVGDWLVEHRRLKDRLVGCTEWIAFDGEMSTRKIIGGFGNVEDNILNFPDGKYRAVALRSFNGETKQWSIWWLDGRAPGQLDLPVVGSFQSGVGRFYSDEMLNGKSIKVRFLWLPADARQARWEQAFSGDGGTTWETNWIMDFSR
jgi:hypothetical protein